MIPRASSDLLDAIIVGGGAAGLSAALVLGRCIRKVLVCDAGNPRNAPARIFNGYLSRDGSTPGEFLQISRDQLRRYETVELRKVKVESAERGDGGFTVTLETGERGPEDAAVAAEERAELIGALARLPATYQSVLRLRLIEGRSAGEIARAMKRSPEAVRQLQHRALGALRAELDDDEERSVDPA